MKLFKWHLIDDIELRCFENGLIKELKQRLDIAEKDNWDKYLKIKKLEKELLWYKNHQKIEVVNVDNIGTSKSKIIYYDTLGSDKK